MLRKIRNRLTYANVMSTLAVFIALGGSSYAALKVGTRDIKNNAVRSVDLRNNDVRGKDLRNGTLTGVDVKRDALGGSVIAESRLGKVPAAGNADRVGGRSVEELRVRCPAGTRGASGRVLRGGPSSPLSYLVASNQCTLARTACSRPAPSSAAMCPRGSTRWLPGGEFTSKRLSSAPASCECS